MKRVRMCITWGIIIMAIAAFLIVRVLRKEGPVAPTPDPVVVVQSPIMGSVELATSLIGITRPADTVYIYPKVDGDVTAVNVEAGDTVATGQVLTEIDTKQMVTSKNAMDTARVAQDDAVPTLNRMMPPHASGFASDEKFGGYQTAVGAKRLQYESVKIGYETWMEFGHVISPINGRMEQLNVEFHDTVGSPMQMHVTAGEGGNNVTFYMTKRVKDNLSLDAPVIMTKEGNQYDGSVVEINNMAEASVGLFKVKASVDDQEAMTPGTSVEIQVPSAPIGNVMLIPNHCVCYKSGDAYVYTYDQAKGMIHEVPAEVGVFDSESIFVLSGLTLGDMILTTWISELKEGAKVALDMETGEDAGQTDEAEGPTAGTSAAQ